MKNEWISVPSNVPELLAYALIHLSAFWSVEVHFHSENLILPYFSSFSMVASLVCESHRQVGSSSNTLAIPLSILAVKMEANVPISILAGSIGKCKKLN